MDLHAHPRSLIQIMVQSTSTPTSRFSKPFRAFSTEGEVDDSVAEEDKRAVELACALNAATCALIDLGGSIGLRGLAFAVAVAVVGGVGAAQSRVVLDPPVEVEREAAMTLVIGFSFGHGEGAGGDEGVMVWCETCSTAPDSTGVSRASVRDVSARNRTARVWHDGRPSLCYSPATDEFTAGRGDRARADSLQGDTRLRAQSHRGQAVVTVRCIRALTRWAVLWSWPHRHACATPPSGSHSPLCVSQSSACAPGPGP